MISSNPPQIHIGEGIGACVATMISKLSSLQEPAMLTVKKLKDCNGGGAFSSTWCMQQQVVKRKQWHWSVALSSINEGSTSTICGLEIQILKENHPSKYFFLWQTVLKLY